MTENWLPVVKFEGLYSVSDLGRVRSEERLIKAFGGGTRTWKGGILKADADSQRYPRVALWCENVFIQVRVHVLMAEAFLGPCPDGMEILHWDDDPANTMLSNIRYGTHAENGQDYIRLHPTCRKGHEFTSANTYIRPDTGQRCCRTCRRDHMRAFEKRRRAPRHHCESQ